MNRRERLERLERMAQLAAVIRDSTLAGLATASQRLDAARHALARHDAARTAPPDTDPSPQVEARHGEWRAARRARLNTDLARERAAWADARDRAAVAAGRADVVEKLAQRLRAQHHGGS